MEHDHGQNGLSETGDPPFRVLALRSVSFSVFVKRLEVLCGREFYSAKQVTGNFTKHFL